MTATKPRLSAKQRAALVALRDLGHHNVVTGPMLNKRMHPEGEDFHYDWQGTVQTVSSLVRRGLVEKHNVNRRVSYCITTEGRRAIAPKAAK